MQVQSGQDIPISVVGSSVFGRYPKINLEKTYNLFISDSWLVNYPGYEKTVEISTQGVGRGIFNSIRGAFILTVVGSIVYRINEDLVPRQVGAIKTVTGDVYIDENLATQICLVDGVDAYIYNYETGTFTAQNLTFGADPVLPGYVCYHNTFFLIASSEDSVNSENWYVYDRDTDSTIVQINQFSIQNKPDDSLLVSRLPGRGNNIIVMGSISAEVWTQVGGVNNYSKIQSFNIDNGIVSVSTFASSDTYACWLAQNEKNSPFIVVSNGSDFNRISSDGIDHLLDQISYPEQSTAFFYRRDGHLFYQITFYNEDDDLSLVYDFTTQKFFHLSDQDLSYYPARKVVYFGEDTYFVSINDGFLRKMDTEITTYDGEEIPRIRICNTVRKEDSDRFRAGMFTFWIEQGEAWKYITAPRVDMSISKNGNASFGNVVSKTLNPEGQYRNQIRWWRMGEANEFTIQLRFWGFDRFVCSAGTLTVY